MICAGVMPAQDNSCHAQSLGILVGAFDDMVELSDLDSGKKEDPVVALFLHPVGGFDIHLPDYADA